MHLDQWSIVSPFRIERPDQWRSEIKLNLYHLESPSEPFFFNLKRVFSPLDLQKFEIIYQDFKAENCIFFCFIVLSSSSTIAFICISIILFY